jgi:hypothetical protein
VPVARDAQELLSPAFNLLTILFKGVFGFAAVGVINGVFMHLARKYSWHFFPDDEVVDSFWRHRSEKSKTFPFHTSNPIA